MNCCSNCFSDKFLQNYISDLSTEKGKCNFCKTRKHYPLIEPSVLLDIFQPVFDLYSEESNGSLLNELLQENWHIFSKDTTGEKQLQLLSLIIGDNEILSKTLIPKFISKESVIEKWNDFANKLKHEKRFFPKSDKEISELSELFNYLIMPKENIPKNIYRARIDRDSMGFSINEMGKPPLKKSTDGRANPKGISYFYGASDIKTAIAECRPYKTDIIYVAKFKVSPKITFIDLTNPQSTISPFNFDDDTLTELHEQDMPLLIHLSDKLSQPVLPHKKELEYLPTQYLCELIKEKEFNGIAYRSSLERGFNYVVFDESLLIGKKVDKYIISDTLVKPVKQKTTN
jgi:hypothetical protein